MVELTKKSAGHSIFVLYHAADKARGKKEVGINELTEFRNQSILPEMVRDLYKFEEKKSYERAKVLQKAEEQRIGLDLSFLDKSFPKTNGDLVSKLKSIEWVFKSIKQGNISGVHIEDINKARGTLYEFLSYINPELQNKDSI